MLLTLIMGSTNYQYDCSTLSPVAALRTALASTSVWTTGSSNENYQAPGCSYACVAAGCTQTSDTVQAGSGVLTSSSNTITPQTTFFEDGRQQFLYLASEINAAGAAQVI